MSAVSYVETVHSILPSLVSGFAISASLIICYAALKAVYNVFFHPLRRYPGPKLWAASSLPSALNLVSGTPHRKLLELHKQYGDVVRIGPSELAFAHEGAWKEINGHLKGGAAENEKDPKSTNVELTNSVISASRERHGPLRRVLAHGFSQRAMVEQQPLVNQYIDLLMQRIKEHGEKGTRPLNMTKWYEWTSFDLVGELAFGDSFGCLQNSSSHPWVDLLFDFMRYQPIQQAMHDIPCFSFLKPTLLALLVPRRVARGRKISMELSREAVGKRMELGAERPDFMTSMLRESEYKMTYSEIVDTSILLVTAGSETTSTALAGTTYLLCSHPETLAKLNAEVRSTFQNESDIDIHSVQNLTYMLAILKESMRVYPPVPIALQRRSPPGGTVIAGNHVPGGTTLGIWQYALYHNPTKFFSPDSFIPERWLGDERFESDQKDLFQPFSLGPRNCIGMNLAYTEMRLILARIIWNFDMKLAEDSTHWDSNQETYFFWKKPPLNVYLKPRQME